MRQTLLVPPLLTLTGQVTPLSTACVRAGDSSSYLSLWKTALGEWKPLCPRDEPCPSCWQLTGNDWHWGTERPASLTLSGTNSEVQVMLQSPLWDQVMASLWLRSHPS